MILSKLCVCRAKNQIRLIGSPANFLYVRQCKESVVGLIKSLLCVNVTHGGNYFGGHTLDLAHGWIPLKAALDTI